jgi:hypothetical protein
MEENEQNVGGEILDAGVSKELTDFLERYEAATEGNQTTTETPTETQVETPTEQTTETQVEPQVEAKVETPTEVAEATQEAAQEPIKEPLFELLTEQANTKPTAETPMEVKLPKEVEERLSLVESYESRLKAIDENPLVKALAYAESPEQIRQIAREIAGEDVSKLSVSELIRREAEASGLEGEELTIAVEEEMASYESMTRLARKSFENNLKAKYDKGGESKTLQALEEAFKAKEKERVNPEENQRLLEEAIKNDTEKLQNIASKYVGQEVSGFKVPEDFSQKVIELYNSDEFNFFDERGNFREDKFAQLAFWKLYGTTLLQAQKEAAKKQVIQERSNPSKDGIIAGQTPTVDNRTDDEKFIKALFEGQIDVNKIRQEMA